jgi:hypothetical protein
MSSIATASNRSVLCLPLGSPEKLAIQKELDRIGKEVPDLKARRGIGSRPLAACLRARQLTLRSRREMDSYLDSCQ